MKMIDFLRTSILEAINGEFPDRQWNTSLPMSIIGENDFNVLREWFDEEDNELKIGYSFDTDDLGAEILVVRFLVSDNVKRFESIVPEKTYIVGELLSIGIEINDFWNSRRLFKDDLITIARELLLFALE